MLNASVLDLAVLSGAASCMKPCCEKARQVQFRFYIRGLKAAGASAGGSNAVGQN